MKLLILMMFLAVSVLAKDTSWAGKWHINWKAGTFTLHLQQKGQEVTGSYEPSHGTLTGVIHGDTLEAHTVSEDNVTSKIILTMGENKKSFFGNTKYGDWITGIRVKDDHKFNAVKIDQSSPLMTFYSFLAVGNSVREGNFEILVKAWIFWNSVKLRKNCGTLSNLLMLRLFLTSWMSVS